MDSKTLPTTEKHLVIGAGFVGLGMAQALKRAGIAYDQVDADDDIGGNWYHGVYRHVHIISSKKTTQFTDYPMPADYPDFPSAAQMLAYLRDYADHFGLRPHIECNKAVKWCVPTSDEKWHVTFTDGEERIYKGVLACNGHHWDPRYAEWEGDFAGELMHSKDYTGEEQLKNKRVLVIGGGNSGCDIAVDAGKVAAEAHISLKRGYWFLPKTMLGRPSVEFIKPWLPVWAQRLLIRFLLRIVVGRYKDYGLQTPTHKVFSTHPTLNSLLLYYLKHGVITPQKQVERVDGTRVTFVDGKTIDVDLIVSATGYKLSYPFLPKELLPIKGVIPQIPQGTFHPTHKGLYIIGAGQTRYGVGPLVTAGGKAIVAAIQTQEKTERPIGAIMAKLGIGPPESHIMDPMKSIARSKKAARRLKMLLWLEKRRFKTPWQAPQVQYPAPPAQLARIY